MLQPINNNILCCHEHSHNNRQRPECFLLRKLRNSHCLFVSRSVYLSVRLSVSSSPFS